MRNFVAGAWVYSPCILSIYLITINYENDKCIQADWAWLVESKNGFAVRYFGIALSIGTAYGAGYGCNNGLC